MEKKELVGSPFDDKTVNAIDKQFPSLGTNLKTYFDQKIKDIQIINTELNTAEQKENETVKPYMEKKYTQLSKSFTELVSDFNKGNIEQFINKLDQYLKKDDRVELAKMSGRVETSMELQGLLSKDELRKLEIEDTENMLRIQSMLQTINDFKAAATSKDLFFGAKKDNHSPSQPPGVKNPQSAANTPPASPKNKAPKS